MFEDISVLISDLFLIFPFCIFSRRTKQFTAQKGLNQQDAIKEAIRWSKWIQMNRRIWSTLPIRIQTHLGQKTSSQLGLGPFVVDRCPGVSCLALPYLLDRKIRCIIASRMMDKSLGICKLHELTKNKVWVNKKLIIWHKPELWVSGYHYHHFLWIWPALHGCA